jgi:hypothetical protein
MSSPSRAFAIVAALICAGTAFSKTAPKARVRRPVASPLYSFVPHEPGTVEGLLKQLDASPQLQQRYANHFHASRADVLQFFRTKLVAKTVTKTRPYTVWMAKPDGRKYSHQKTIRKGDRILALADGTPILSAKCGNPFLSHIKFIKRKPSRHSTVKPMTMSRRRGSSTVTPYETAGGFLAEAPYELPMDMRFADVPLSVLRSRQYFVPLWWKSGHSHPEVPEPGTLAFLAAAALPLIALARKRSA